MCPVGRYVTHGPVAPWSHTDIEWREMVAIIVEDKQHDPLTFQVDCQLLHFANSFIFCLCWLMI